MSEWTEVEDTLPEENKVVFVTVKGFDDPEWVEEIGIPRTWVTEATFECQTQNSLGQTMNNYKRIIIAVMLILVMVSAIVFSIGASEPINLHELQLSEMSCTNYNYGQLMRCVDYQFQVVCYMSENGMECFKHDRAKQK